jgi:hypothetical protein
LSPASFAWVDESVKAHMSYEAWTSCSDFADELRQSALREGIRLDQIAFGEFCNRRSIDESAAHDAFEEALVREMVRSATVAIPQPDRMNGSDLARLLGCLEARSKRAHQSIGDGMTRT